ncbi:hypothetical protein, partial [Escherichia coli]|uniref:hypothetical protein n=1 Tax=Escherichia coli TaxID=562 RepID=UPI0022452BA5
GMKKTAPDGAVSGMPAIRETGPGKNLQAITVSTKSSKFNILQGLRRPDWHSASGSIAFISSLNFNPLATLQYLTLY